MSRIRSVLVLVLLATGAVLAAQGGEAAPRGGSKAEPKKAPGGSTYRNAQLGVRARGPAGWKMKAEKASAPSKWRRLVAFDDPTTGAQVTLSVRPRKAATLDDLLTSVRREWDAARDRLRVSSMRKIEASALNKIGQVIVDAGFTRKAKPKKATKGVPAPPSPDEQWKVQATYYLAEGNTYMLYGQGRDTHWSRLRGRMVRVRESVQFDKEADTGPKGEGSYRNEKAGFTCRFPKGYTVVTPQRENHLVQFRGVADEDPVLSVYGFKWEQAVDKDAERLVAHYEEDKGGTASARTTEVSGLEGMLVTAKATIGGVDRVVLIAVVKRGDDCYRLRASMPAASESKGTSMFRQFVAGFRLTRAP